MVQFTEGENARRRPAILALLPFLVKGALALSVLRAMQDRGFDVSLAYYLPEAVGYTRDPAEDFSARDRLIDMTELHGPEGVDYLLRIVADRRIALLLQVGATQAYQQIPYIKERMPTLATLDTLYNPVGHVANHFLYEHAFDGVVVESAAMRDYVLANTRRPMPAINLVESGIDLHDFYPQPRDETRRGLTLGYLGRMSPEKNPLGFVTLAEHLHAALPDLRFRLYGEGALTGQIVERVARSPAAHAIEFVGYVAHARDALNDIDVLVVPSKVDGRPNAIMEANACGVPVFGAPVGGIPELIAEGVNGYLVAPDQPAQMVAILRAWLQAPTQFLAICRSAQQVAELRFDRRRMLDVYADAFSRAAYRATGPTRQLLGDRAQ